MFRDYSFVETCIAIMLMIMTLPMALVTFCVIISPITAIWYFFKDRRENS